MINHPTDIGYEACAANELLCIAPLYSCCSLTCIALRLRCAFVLHSHIACCGAVLRLRAKAIAMAWMKPMMLCNVVLPLSDHALTQAW